jgi:hypothetical protein
MGKKYFDTKAETLESSILGVWAEAAKKVSETNKNNKSDDGDGLDAVQPKAVKKKFKDRKDKDVDNDGDVDDSDKFLHKRRKAVSKAMKDEGNAFGKALNAARDKGEKTFVVAGKKYDVKESVDLDEGTKQVLAHGGKGKYKVTKDGDKIEIKFGGKVVGTADFDRGADSFFVSIKGEKGQKSFDDAQAIADYFAKNKITEEVDLDEDFSVEVPKQKIAGKTYGGGATVIVKAKTAYQAIKMVAKRLDVDVNLLKTGKVVKEEADLDEGLGVAEDVPAMEVGTDRYREYAVGLTPGENAEFAAAQDFKVASMKEALAKVWGLDEKTLDKTSKEDYDEEDEELKPVKGSKTMTGGKVAKVNTKPKIG